jgi:hypothetical protein
MIHKDENTDHLKLPEKPEILITFLDRNGNYCDTDKQAVAKCVEYFHGYNDISVHYFVRVGSGEVLDPHGTHRHLNQQKLKRFEFRKVNQNAWISYSNYLKNKKRQFFTNARRLIME